MADDNAKDRRYLTRDERVAAAVFGVALFVLAGWMVIAPPDRFTAIAGCTPSSSIDCVVAIDGDVATFATAIAALGAAALLVALLGIRFSKFSAGGVSAEGPNFEETYAGLPTFPTGSPAALPAPEEESGEAADRRAVEELIRYTEEAPRVPRFKDLGPNELNGLRDEIYDRQHRVFLSQALGETNTRGQEYRVALFLVGHKKQIDRTEIRGARMFLGPSWGSRTFEAAWDRHGRLGIVVEAFGTFLVLCEVEFTSGDRILLHHYVDTAQLELMPHDGARA